MDTALINFDLIEVTTFAIAGSFFLYLVLRWFSWTVNNWLGRDKRRRRPL